MSGYFYSTARPAVPRRQPVGTRPTELRGIASVGRIVKLFVGQGHGLIRLANNREVYFHRTDIRESTSINELVVGDSVTFELFEDRVSGARALQVKRQL